MSEPVKEAPAKTEQVNGDGTSTGHPNENVEHETKEKPKMSSEGAKISRDSYEARHTQLTCLIRKSVEEHKSGIKMLTRRQLVIWRDELIQLYDQAKEAHKTYVNVVRDITEEERSVCDAWKTQFDTDHTSIIQSTDRYSKPRSSTKSVGKSQLSVISSKASTVNAFAKLTAELKSEMLKASAESNARLEAMLFESNAKLDKKIQASNSAILEDFFKRSNAQMSKIDSSNVNTLKTADHQVTQQLRKLKEEVAEVQCEPFNISNEVSWQLEAVSKPTDEYDQQLHEINTTNAQTQDSRPTTLHVTTSPAPMLNTTRSQLFNRRKLLSDQVKEEIDPKETTPLHPDQMHVVTRSTSMATPGADDSSFSNVNMSNDKSNGCPIVTKCRPYVNASSHRHAVYCNRPEETYDRPEFVSPKCQTKLAVQTSSISPKPISLKTPDNEFHEAVALHPQGCFDEVIDITTEVTLNALYSDGWPSTKTWIEDDHKDVPHSPLTSTYKDAKFDENSSSYVKNGSPTVSTSTSNCVTTSNSQKAFTISPPTLASPRDQHSEGGGTEFKAKEDRCCTGDRNQHHLIHRSALLNSSLPKRTEDVFSQVRQVKSAKCLSSHNGKHEGSDSERSLRCSVSKSPDLLRNVILYGSDPILSKNSSGPPTLAAQLPEVLLGRATLAETDQRSVVVTIVPVRVQTEEECFKTSGFHDSEDDGTQLTRNKVMKKPCPAGTHKRPKVIGYDRVGLNANSTDTRFFISSVDGRNVSNVKRVYSIDKCNAASSPPITERHRKLCIHLCGWKIPHVQPEDVNVLVEMKLVEVYDPEVFIKPLAATRGPINFESPFVWYLGYQTGPPVASPQVPYTANKQFSKILQEPATKFRHLEVNDVTVDQLAVSYGNLRRRQVVKLSKSVEDTAGLKKHQAHDPTSNVLVINKQFAPQRLSALERRLSGDEDFAKKYENVAQEYVHLGHAPLLSTEERKAKKRQTWYFPRHRITSSFGTMVRVILDTTSQAATEHEDTSLFLNLLRRPNLHVRDAKEDRLTQRIAYQSPGIRPVPLTFEVGTNVFGEVSESPIYVFAFNEADGHKEERFPEAADNMRKTSYVSNYLNSFDSSKEVVQWARQMNSSMESDDPLPAERSPRIVKQHEQLPTRLPRVEFQRSFHSLRGDLQPYAWLPLVNLNKAGLNERRAPQMRAILDHLWKSRLKKSVLHLPKRNLMDNPLFYRRSYRISIVDPNDLRGQLSFGPVLDVRSSPCDNVIRVVKVTNSSHL